MDQAVKKKNSGFSPIWILPFVAFCIGAWILYASIRDDGIDIQIHFENADGITPEKTEVLYRGIPTGKVKKISVDEDLKGVTLNIEMDKNTRNALVVDTKFWIVRPELEAGKVRGLGTILTGSYIAIQPGNTNKFSLKYQGLSEAPPLPQTTPGLRISLEAESLYSLQKGSNVYTKDIKIGQVVDFHLTKQNKVIVDLHIDPAFAGVINSSTKFWNSSGVSLGGDLQRGFNLQLESLAAMFYGGISCGTSEYATEVVPVSNNHVFPLYKNHAAAESGIPVFLKLTSGGGIVEGKTKVIYRGIKAGIVKKIQINHDDSHSVTAELMLDPRAEPILKTGTSFWVIKPIVSVDGIKNIDTIISGSYITFEPGEGEFQDQFTVNHGDIPNSALSAGTIYKLQTTDPYSLEIGSPLFHKKIKVGEVVNISFSTNSPTIVLELLVYEMHTHLIRKNTAFWNAGGFQADVKLSGVKLNFSSIKTILAGGIAFDNPPTENTNAEPADKTSSFNLYKSFKEVINSQPEFQPSGLNLQLRAGKIRGLRSGSPVLYNNFKVGEITGFELDKDNLEILINILINESYVSLLNVSSRFYNLSGMAVKIGIDGLELQTGSFESIAAGGIAFYTQDKDAKYLQDQRYILHENISQAELADSYHLLIRFPKSAEIKEKTKIKYKGVIIGTLKNIRFANSLSEVLCDAYVDRDAAELFRESTRLWLVKPRINITGAENLSTIFSGAYLTLTPGKGKLAKELMVKENPPRETIHHDNGLHVVLESPSLGSLKQNSPVYFRQIPVGKVIAFELSPTAQEVWIHLYIKDGYKNLVHGGSKFWIASGISMQGGLFSEFRLVTESMEALISGGIAFATPEGLEMGGPAEDGDHFFLHHKKEEKWQDWRPQITIDSKMIQQQNK